MLTILVNNCGVLEWVPSKCVKTAKRFNRSLSSTCCLSFDVGDVYVELVVLLSPSLSLPLNGNLSRLTTHLPILIETFSLQLVRFLSFWTLNEEWNLESMLNQEELEHLSSSNSLLLPSGATGYGCFCSNILPRFSLYPFFFQSFKKAQCFLGFV